MPLALLALTIGAFAIGTTEFVIVGLVPRLLNNWRSRCLLPACWFLSTHWGGHRGAGADRIDRAYAA
jgi:hypothetical protein